MMLHIVKLASVAIVGFLGGVSVGFAGGLKAGRREFVALIRGGVFGYGPDYPRGNRLQAQANEAFMRERKSRIIKPSGLVTP